MATRCEDAPCCGCCGTNLYGVSQDSSYDDAYDAYAEDYYVDPMEDDSWDDEPFVMEDQWLDGSYEE